MGMGPFKSCDSCTPTSNQAPAPNPNPGRFVILGTTQVGPHLIARIHYLDCTNFEGIKLCVYKNMTARELYGLKYLDPHFSEELASPIARFRSTVEGEILADKFTRHIL